MQSHKSSADDLTTVQSCDILGINTATLTRWVKRGLIEPTFKFPGHRGGYLFKRADIEKLAADRAEQSA